MVGFRKPRKPRPKKTGVPKGYDSLWEVKLHETVLKDWEHHWELYDYIVKHKYEPDFVKVIDGKTILLEAKGRFCLLYTSPSPRDGLLSRMPSSA